MNQRRKPTGVHLLFILLALVFSGLLQQCVQAAPIEEIEAKNSTLAKRYFIPTDAQCDQQLKSVGILGADKSIFYSRPAQAGLWAAKLNRIPINLAFGDWMKTNNLDSPQYGVTPANLAQYMDEDIDGQIWAKLSAAYARATTGTAYVALNPGQVVIPTSNWASQELPILRKNGITIMQVDATNTDAQPVQIWPPPAQGAPPTKA